MNPKILTLSFCCALASTKVQAQNISFNPFVSAPLAVNPAFTGLFEGKLRANVLYRNQWSGASIPYISMVASTDARVFKGRDSYLAAGVHVFRGTAGDGSLNSFLGLASVAYHKTVRKNIRLGLGVQGGYSQTSFDQSKLYFNQPWQIVPLVLRKGITSGSYLINAGATVSHNVSKRFNYMVGLSAHNIYQPRNPYERSQWEDAGNARNYNAVLSAQWQVVDRFSVRPSFLYQVNTFNDVLIGGSEFHWTVSASEKSQLRSTVFAGLWYRTRDIASMMAGTEIRRFRASVAYDYSLSAGNLLNYGRGGIEAAVRYILP